jgi:glycosyltransferase involved in cell wall biosynthesis
MRILFINNYFEPEPNFFKGLPLAKKMMKFGHEVEVLTGFPNYPGGKIYDGYRIRLIQRENLEGVPVIRVPLYPSHDRSAMRRIVSYLTVAVSASTIGISAIHPADVAYVVQGPATMGLPAIIAKLVRGIPFVYDIADLWPDVLSGTGMFDSSFGSKIVANWCKLIYKSASKIIVITPGVRQKLRERGVPENKIELIYEWCDDAQVTGGTQNPRLAKELSMEGRFNIVFAGNMGKAQSLTAVLEAAKIIAAEHPLVQFVFIGSGIEVASLKEKVAAMNLQNVLFHSRRPISEIGAILRLADVLLVHLRDDPIFRIAIPSKTQAYMAIGRPILMGVRGDAADLVTKAKCGLVCEQENPQSIAEAVAKFLSMSKADLDQMGENGRKFYEQELSFEIAARKYEKIFESVARKSRKPNQIS